jgi:hypothetical protein
MIAADMATLKHAAELLEADARDLRECHNLDPQRPDWKDEPEARIAHDDALCTALRLRVLARRIKAGQFTVSPAPTIGGRHG